MMSGCVNTYSDGRRRYVRAGSPLFVDTSPVSMCAYPRYRVTYTRSQQSPVRWAMVILTTVPAGRNRTVCISYPTDHCTPAWNLQI